ncbi:hypothetical protein [Actinomadura macra]|uniref:hypothetical protein n=1 Tax=Actinomadura macra TaxID=46164 RepID=UPI000834D75F|nr:hypothetical protein [Actinomadura macra]
MTYAERIPRALETLERERVTGILRIGDEGALHIADGAVTHAESRDAPGAGDLLRSSRGADPELPALVAMFDAAYFLLGSEAEPAFTEGSAARGRCPRTTAATLVREQRRRRDLLDAVWPSANVDAVPVEPVRRVRRQRVILTGLQTEILLNADGRSTPVDLAHRLGRTGFACLLAVRGLAAASLIRAAAQGTCAVREAEEVGAELVSAPPGGFEPPTQWAAVDHELLTRLRAALAELG